jgi:hypothetical protein
MSNSVKIRPFGTELFHAERYDETVAFRSFAQGPKNKDGIIIILNCEIWHYQNKIDNV